MERVGKSFLFPVFLFVVQAIALITFSVYYYHLLPNKVPFFYDTEGRGVFVHHKKLFFSLQLLVFFVICTTLLLLAALSLTTLPMKHLEALMRTDRCETYERTLREFVCKSILWTCVFTAQFLLEAYLVNFEMAHRNSTEIFYWFWLAVGAFLVEMVGLILYRYYRYHCYYRNYTQGEPYQSEGHIPPQLP
ncbi:hypothetical protein K493DRAFT_319574 [Basidiobolus meristosporus CBS 931.73]|uniref:DUF1648 domain-containing protein n=1 Tax=Basidiobolus meristosporus CBS 931.73 TaxID=1314790 RepID=A0A1Y1XQM4_9FUNG|nr:hypothetical protein K493DRAFT_319574 [Basidiobolus meristosporus CBS 931.73]|eukprot:ORX88048.1 hypothetical protein K493DRAFT_319574 [Basidiobolus meristosporus CBS 931.73]